MRTHASSRRPPRRRGPRESPWAAGVGADLTVGVVVFALWPFQEWRLHVYILHWRPRRMFGRTVDLYAGRKHRAHHRDPMRPGLIFIPTRIVLTSLIVLPLAWLLPLSLATGLTGIAIYYTFASTYEWTHFLIHSTYRPQSKWYKRVWRNHRLHHFRNEHYWFGVSRLFGDKVLGADPDPAQTPISPTCMTLGIESELADATTL